MVLAHILMMIPFNIYLIGTISLLLSSIYMVVKRRKISINLICISCGFIGLQVGYSSFAFLFPVYLANVILIIIKYEVYTHK